MSFLNVYIGDLSDPKFSWENGNWDGNIPTRTSPFFPTRTAFSKLIDMIEEGKLEGKQTDWGGWTAKATKEQIKLFFEETSREYVKQQDPKFFQHLIDNYNDLVKFIDNLEPDKEYALVACEL